MANVVIRSYMFVYHTESRSFGMIASISDMCHVCVYIDSISLTSAMFTEGRICQTMKTIHGQQEVFLFAASYPEA